ncbi:MAG: NHLP family bacteriocin export ABC transporter peptidase/permease/ATPase subunit [Vicinamibacterales bacterium]
MSGAPLGSRPRLRRVVTPTVIQMEAVECGAAALSIILGYHGRIASLEELRVACGVSRDGSKVSNILKAARTYGMTAKGWRKDVSALATFAVPFVVFWNFNHFLVVEGFGKGRVYLNDPASGRRVVTDEEFDRSYTGIALEITPSPEFKKGGQRRSIVTALRRRLSGSETAVVFAVLVGLVLVLPGLVIPTFTRIFVDNVLIARMDDWIRPLIAAMALTLAARASATWLLQHYLLRLETKLALTTSSRFLWHVLRLPMVFFAQRAPGEIGTRVAINDRVAMLLSGDLASTGLSLVTIVFFAVLMLTYDLPLTLATIAIAALNVVALRTVSRVRVDGNQKLLQDRGKLVGATMGGLQMIETLKSGGTESDFFVRWSGYQAKVVNGEQALGVPTQMLSAVPPFLMSMNTLAILWFGGLRVMDGAMSIGMLMAFQSLAASFMEPVSKLVTLGSVIQEVEGDMNRLDDVLNYESDPQAARAEPPEDGTDQLIKLNGHLELKNLTFGYSRLEPPLIADFSLTLRPGERVALVGGTGSGKSTISRLVTGLYEPWSGEILFDGMPRSAIPRSVMTNSLGLVDQDIFLFEGSVRDNLTMWDTTVPEASIIRATKDAVIHSDVADRPRGYDGRVDEGGRNFSGGQRQRLEIARALVGNPTIVVLDEATSALDAETEKLVDDSLRRRGCTCLIVAHRLSTIRDCDEIIVLERGVVVQRGTHEQMKHVDGPYARLLAT